ncbi:MAG: DNA polymerase III subunit epsilon [Limnohabitans sp.]|nr:DNA polymerase III subunit epsilon [Limnohabitans sp.]
MRQIFLDTETTGLSAEAGDRIIEIGCVELVNRQLTGQNLHFYLNPERDSHEDALKVHGISNEFLRDKPKFAEVASQIADYLRGAEVIIHNAAFDVGFLDKEFERCQMPPLSALVAQVVDTLAMAKELYPGKRNSLDALCDRLGVDNSARTLHGALLDAELLADVYIHMTRGQDALLMEAPVESGPVAARTDIDVSQVQLPVLQPSEAERSAHEEVLAQIDKSSQNKTVWRQAAAALD